MRPGHTQIGADHSEGRGAESPHLRTLAERGLLNLQLLELFEVSAHPAYTTAPELAALAVLDQIVTTSGV